MAPGQDMAVEDDDDGEEEAAAPMEQQQQEQEEQEEQQQQQKAQPPPSHQWGLDPLFWVRFREREGGEGAGWRDG